MNNKIRNRGGWSKSSSDYLDKVKEVLESLKKYWPLTLRQVYYQLVSALVIENNLKSYSKLSRSLTKARLDDLVSWDAIEDRARSFLGAAGWDGMSQFVGHEMRNFLKGYRRDLLCSQAMALEIWVEKDALSRICQNVAFPYCIPVVVARGFSSISYLHDFRKRVERNATKGKQTAILYFGDLDPSGWEMLPSMLETLQREMKLGNRVEGCRCALTPEQVELYNLPHSIDAVKKGDTRAKKYIERFGTLAVELDALPPATLESIVKQSIEEKLDLFKFQEEIEKQEAESNKLSGMKDKVYHFLEEALI